MHVYVVTMTHTLPTKAQNRLDIAVCKNRKQAMAFYTDISKH